MGFLDTSARIRKTIMEDLPTLPDNFVKTLAQGVADYAVGQIFSSAETGATRRYQRIAAAPGYEDMGDEAAPPSRSSVLSTDAPQALSDVRKAIARGNIEAVSRTEQTTAIADATITFETVSKLQASDIPANIEAVNVSSCGADGYGGGTYLRLTSALPKPGVRMSKDGQTWKLKANVITPQHFGGRAGAAGEYDTTEAMIEAMMYAGEASIYTRPQIWLPAVGIYKLSQPIGQYLSRGLQIWGDGQDATRVNVALDANTVLFENGVFTSTPGNPYNRAPAGVGIADIYFDHGAQSAGTIDGTRSRTLIQNNGGSRFSLKRVRAYGFKYVYASTYGADYSEIDENTGVFNDCFVYLGPGANQISGKHNHVANGRDGFVFDRAGWGEFGGSCSFVGMSRADIIMEYYAGLHPEAPAGAGFTRFGLTNVTPGYPGHTQNFSFEQVEHESNNQNDGRGPQQHVWTRGDTAGYPAGLHIGMSKLVAGATVNTASDANARFWRNEQGSRNRIDEVSYYGNRLSKLFTNIIREQIGDIYAEDGSNLPTVFEGGFASEQSYTQNRFNRGTFGQAISTVLKKVRVVGDAVYRWSVRANGLLEWGDGTAAPDTHLGRAGVDSLETGNLRPTTLDITDATTTVDKVIATIGAGAGVGRWRVQNLGNPVNRRALIGSNAAGQDVSIIDPVNGYNTLAVNLTKTAQPNQPSSGWRLYTDTATGKVTAYGESAYGADVRTFHLNRSGSKTYDMPALAVGAQATTTVTVNNVIPGDVVTGWSHDSGGFGALTVTATVTANNTVTLTFLNMSSGTIDPPSGALRVDVSK